MRTEVDAEDDDGDSDYEDIEEDKETDLQEVENEHDEHRILDKLYNRRLRAIPDFQ